MFPVQSSGPRSNLSGITIDLTDIADEVYEVEHHIHNVERWRGIRAVQTATQWADDRETPFRCISGNGVYGADPNDEALVLGTADTPIQSGKTRFDLHRIFVTATSRDTPYKVRLIYGTGTMADAIAAGQFTEVVLVTVASTRRAPIDVIFPLVSSSTKVWAQARNATDNATIDFLVGFHEYE